MFFFLRRQLRATRGILSGFRGNARACLVTEPFWGIPYNLYTTYASVYMLALGCTTTQIGLISSVGLFLQMLLSLLSGVITDRLGRKLTTLIFDTIAWSIPALLWATAQSFPYFLAAGVVNSFVRISGNSWPCLMIEDARPDERVHIYTWISVAGILAGFITPLAGLLVNRFGLVPAMRGVYVLAFVSMTAMFFYRNTIVTETKVGMAKLAEARQARSGLVLAEYGRILRHLARSPRTILAFLISILVSIHTTLRGTFLSIILTRGLGFPAGEIALFPALNAGVMLVVYVLVMPSLGRLGIVRPLTVGLASSAAGSLLLALAPVRSLAAVLVSTALSGFGTALIGPLSDTFVANTVSEEERAKTMSLFSVLMFAVSTPFGYIGGVLSSRSDRLPFLLITMTLLAGVGLAAAALILEKRSGAPRQPAPSRFH